MALTPDTESDLSRLLGEDEADSVVLTVGQLRSFLDGLWTQGGDDEVQGSSDSELIIGNAGQDSLSGGAGNDTLMGDTDNDIVDGQLGGDLVRGDRNDDIVIGGDGADSLYGGKNNDQLFGGAENDFLSGDKGSDTLDGGEGSDTFSLIVDELDVIIGFEDGTDLLKLPDGLTFDNVRAIENFNGGSTLVVLASTEQPLVLLENIAPSNITAADFGFLEEPVEVAQEEPPEEEPVEVAQEEPPENEQPPEVSPLPEVPSPSPSQDAEDDFISGDEDSNILEGSQGSDTFPLSTDELDVVLGFEDGIDILQLPEELTFDEITIAEDLDNAENTLITVTGTGQELALLESIDPSIVTAADFGFLPEPPPDEPIPSPQPQSPQGGSRLDDLVRGITE